MNDKKSYFIGLTVFLLIAIAFRSGGVVEHVPEIFLKCAGAAVIYMAMYLLVFSLSPWKMSLCWLGLPLLIFSASWLRWYWAAVLTPVWFFALYRTCCADSFHYRRGHSVEGFLWGAIVVLCWVYLSGAGGYGQQTADYVMHNGRLEDLVNYSWPVNYTQGIMLDSSQTPSKNSLLVSYSGYYLPAALFGKIFGLRFAMEFMHYWTLLGCWLAYRWLLEITQVKSSMFLAAVFVAFGGWDIAGSFLICIKACQDSGVDIANSISVILSNPDVSLTWIDSELGRILETSYFFGDFVSLTNSLFWAPHQTIAGWIIIGLLLAIWRDNNFKQIIFVYSLLALWAPMIILGLVIFPLVIILQGRMLAMRQAASFENIAGGLMVVFVMGLYYLSATALTNPMGFVFFDEGYKGFIWLLAFNFFGWGVYSFSLYPCIKKMDSVWKGFFYTICATFFMLSCIKYGSYNDLMIRNSAPLMFGLVIIFLKSIDFLISNNKKLHAAFLVFVMLPGVISSIVNVGSSLANYEERIPGESVVNYVGGWQFLGSTDSLYVRIFSAPL